jgi:4'-phosphopantetheinyl transferase
MNSVKVYVADVKALEDAELFNRLYALVPARRQKKINEISFAKDKRCSLGAELVLKKALCDIGITEYEFSFGERGKPYINGENKIYFNLSHAWGRVMCVISQKEVGCDVEKIRDVDLRVAKRFFFADEYETIFAQETPEEQKDMFFRFWTLKESFMKATGLGMKLPLDSFCVSLNDDGVSLTHSYSDDNYYLKEFFLEKDYKYSVCSLVPVVEEPVFVDFLEF